MNAENFEYPAVRNLRVASIVLALLVCAFAGATSWLSLRDEHARQVNTLTTLAEVAAQSLDGYFLSLQSAMQLVAAEILGSEDRIDIARVDSALKRFKAAFPELRIATLAKLDGTIIASTERMDTRASPTMAAQRTFVAAVEDRLRTGNRALTIGRAFYGPLSREWVMPMGYGVWDSKGRLVFILGAGVPLAKPEGIWKDAPLPEGAALGLRRDDGFLMLRYPNTGNLKLDEVYARPATGPLSVFLEKNGYPVRGHLTGVSRLTGEDTLYVFRRLADFPLTFFVSNPVSNIRSAWWDRVWALYVLLLVLVLAGYYVYRWALGHQTAWELERARQIRMLEAANQELEDFAYTIAHDLKAPVRAIDGHAGIAIENSGTGLPDAARQRLVQIRRSAARMGELIDDLLEFSRYSRASVAKQRVDMDSLVRKVIGEVIPADAGIEVEVGQLPACEADPALMGVVWNALVSNAVKYSANSKPPVIGIGFAKGEYFVSDNGVGFDMAHAEKLFGVFSRLHGADEFEGTGAGLAIARRILQRHGGTISGHAEHGRGATFRFTVGQSATEDKEELQR